MVNVYPITGKVWYRESTDEWVLELEGSINDTSFISRHTEPGNTAPEDVPSLPSLYKNVEAEAKLARLQSTIDYMGSLTERLDETEAKLAENEVRLRKAVEVLNALDATLARNGWHFASIAREDIRATLAELKGQDDE